jgi:hypothetical protein
MSRIRAIIFTLVVLCAATLISLILLGVLWDRDNTTSITVIGNSVILLDTSNGPVDIGAPLSPSNGTLLTYRLLYQWGDDAYVHTPRGTAVLTTDESTRTLYWDGVVYRIMGTVTSFFTTTQEGDKLIGSGATNDAQQGYAIAISSNGNTMAVGGPHDANDTGAVWVYRRSGSLWLQEMIVASDAIGAAWQGTAVALSADASLLAVGGPFDDADLGAVWLYSYASGWTQQIKLLPTGQVGAPQLGWCIAMTPDGNTIAVGGPLDNASIGAVWIFVQSAPGVWTQEAKLVGSACIGGFCQQGSDVAISADGNTVAFGGPFDNTLVGATWVFVRRQGVWSEVVKLVGTDGVGSPTQGTSLALSADGNKLVVGGPLDTANTGAVWTFVQSSPLVWTQLGEKLQAIGSVGLSYQGFTVALSADGYTMAVGAPGDDNLGCAFIFTYSNNAGGSWTERAKLIGSNTSNAYLSLGLALSADANTLAMGGPGDDNLVGAIWIFI